MARVTERLPGRTSCSSGAGRRRSPLPMSRLPRRAASRKLRRSRPLRPAARQLQRQPRRRK
eukprot:5956444-Lingulodinium_polyedra.AAC.1